VTVVGGAIAISIVILSGHMHACVAYATIIATATHLTQQLGSGSSSRFESTRGFKGSCAGNSRGADSNQGFLQFAAHNVDAKVVAVVLLALDRQVTSAFFIVPDADKSQRQHGNSLFVLSALRCGQVARNA